jgi:hypothetical protein
MVFGEGKESGGNDVGDGDCEDCCGVSTAAIVSSLNREYREAEG